MTTRQTQLSPAEWLDLIADRAERLRKAGVLEVQLEGCSVKLATYEEPVAAGEDEEELGWHPDPLKDPATYGGVLPGWGRSSQGGERGRSSQGGKQ